MKKEIFVRISSSLADRPCGLTDWSCVFCVQQQQPRTLVQRGDKNNARYFEERDANNETAGETRIIKSGKSENHSLDAVYIAAACGPLFYATSLSVRPLLRMYKKYARVTQP